MIFFRGFEKKTFLFLLCICTTFENNYLACNLSAIALVAYNICQVENRLYMNYQENRV